MTSENLEPLTRPVPTGAVHAVPKSPPPPRRNRPAPDPQQFWTVVLMFKNEPAAAILVGPHKYRGDAIAEALHTAAANDRSAELVRIQVYQSSSPKAAE